MPGRGRVKTRIKRQAKIGANVGYEGEFWKMADALRGSMDAAEYKHVVLGLIFLKYISDAFEDKMERLVAHLREQQAEAARLDAAIEATLKALGLPLEESAID